MTVEEALQTLIDFNNWRRDDEVPSKYKMPEPSKIGEAIDVVICILEHLVKGEEDVRNHLIALQSLSSPRLKADPRHM